MHLRIFIIVYLMAENQDLISVPPSFMNNEENLIKSEANGADVDDNEDDDVGISIETTQDGTLKLSCADPQVLQVPFFLNFLMCLLIETAFSYRISRSL